MIRSHVVSKRSFFFVAFVFVILCLLYESYWTNNPSLASIPPTAPVAIRWSTRREEKTAGYMLYRAENRAGPFRQLNRELIPASNDPYLGGTYVYTDTETTVGITYYYELEDISLDGQRTRQAPITVTARGSSPTILGWAVTEELGLILILVIATIMMLSSRIIFMA